MNNRIVFCRLFSLLLLLLLTIKLYPYDFKVDGIYYNKISNNEVEVTYKSTSDRGYSGKITIPNSIQYGGNTYNVTSIGESAFYNCSGLTGSLTIPNSVTSIGNFSFYRCSGLTGSLTIPNSVTSIGNSAFNQCSGFTGSLTIPNSVTFIGEAAFTNCTGFTGSLTISNSVTAIRKYCFQSCNFTGPLTIPNSVTMIEEAAFNGCHGLTGSLIIPSSVTSIGGGAFQDCMGLTGLTIPNSVKSIESEAFINCKNMDIVKSEIEKPFSIDTYVFWLNNSKHKTLQVPKGTKSKYTAFTGWTNFFNEVIEDEGITVTTYTLSIKATGSGSASYNGTTIRGKTSSFTVNEGTSVSISITPDNGYRIKSVKENDTNVTAYVSNGTYTISNISRDTNVEVEFEAIPPTTYTLSITATGNGTAAYNGTTIRGKTSSFTVNEGTSATVSFSPDNGYRIKDVKVNNTDVTSSVSSNQYTISNISANTTLEVEFEAIPTTTYTLSIKATGNGSFSYNGTSVRKSTASFSVNAGSNATITFNPDNGHRIKYVKVNDSDVTSSVSNNSYTISNISANTTLEVEFEAIPPTTYTLSIKATGNGSASYNGTTIRSKTNTFTVNEGANAIVTFAPDNGYRIKSVKVNSADVTSSVSSNQYTINNISANTTLEVEFEAIPATTYTLSIKVTGNGSVLYNETTIRSKTSTFTVNDGASVSISITPDNGYRIKSVKENNTNVTSYVSNNTYTISSISRNTTIEVEFEAIPQTTYTLSIKATGNGYVSYNGTTTRNETNSFTINEGDNALLTFVPESGYRLASVRINNSDVSSWVYNNQYTISNISSNTTVEVTFEAIPVTTYSLSISASGNGYATYNGSAIRNRTTSFTADEGTSATIIFTPDNGNSIASVKLNNSDITSQISGNSYTISNITANTTLTVTFQEDVNALTVDGLNYTVTSQSNKTVALTGGGTGLVLTVPATITQNGTTWKVTGIDQNALKGNAELAAIIWNPEAAFTATVSNPNLLLYVKAEQFAPASIQNVVVNGTASNIVLAEAKSGNNFYCPQSFVAQKISYTHNYKMQTGIGEARGWETIALPFDVQTITHATKGEIKPFAHWKSGDAAKPFWLMELTGTGFVETGSIKAYTPYIISMPNNPQYDNQWLLNGKVTFAASSVTVGKTENLSQPTFNGRTFIPCLTDMDGEMAVYSLNVNNDYESNNSGMTEGSMFVWKLRHIHPFEAYMTSTSSAPQFAFGVFEGMTTGIQTMVDGDWTKEDVVYDLQGRCVQTSNLFARPHSHREKSQTSNLKKGVYIVNGKKKIIK